MTKTAIAKVTKLFGRDGEVMVRLYDIFPDTPQLSEPLFVDIDGLAVPLFIKSFSKKGNDKAQIAFEDIDTDFRAQEIIDKELYTFDGAEDEDKDDDEIYYEDLVDYSVIDIKTGRMGVITDYINNEKNPLFGAQFDDIEVMIPAVDDIINSIDTDNQTIEVSLPDGLLELYTSSDNYDE